MADLENDDLTSEVVAVPTDAVVATGVVEEPVGMVLPTQEDIEKVLAKVSPVAIMTDSLKDFYKDVFDMGRQQEDYLNFLRQGVMKDWDKFKPSEKAALITAETSNRNDLVSKVVTPLTQLLTSAQANELADKRERDKSKQDFQSPSNIRSISELAPTEVLVGLQALVGLAAPLQKKAEVTQEQATQPANNN